ncbi:MAG: nucleotidyl transferase AbiEii/AbiGii toxin family protein [Acidobacteriia bacterium]|nr:nucleotidyl transferase AbiEii/AbiGii toxin family protein [Terriglobia bacterium]
MILKQDILDRATEWRLRPDIVEKDYVLGWLLAALSMQQEIRDLWVFKGGTCIKKCFFETYRFSEDLDFSLLPEAPYTDPALRGNLLALTRTAHELSGIEFPEDLVEVRSTKNKQNQVTFQGRIAYRGPLEFPGTPKILFDIT